MKKGVFAHIKAKDSFINFYSKHVQLEFFGVVKYYEEYSFEVGKNLTKINSYDDCPINLNYIDKNKNIFTLTSDRSYENFLNDASNILKILGYIDNKFYLEDKEKNYLYFGGIPQNVNENYNLFSLKGLTYINFKLKVKFDNGTKYETNAERIQISFSSNERYKYLY